MKLTIQAKSSGAEPYTVAFLVDNNMLSVHCDCPAGAFGKNCKHKTELLAGDATRLYDESDVGALEQLATIVARAPEFERMAREIAELEKTVRSQQSKLKKTKSQLEQALKTGIELG